MKHKPVLDPQRFETQCPICKHDVIGLFVDDGHIDRTEVIWCVDGHVSVKDNSNTDAKIVYDFSSLPVIGENNE